MTASIETRKLRIIDSLVNLNDEYVIQLIEAILHSESDFWNELSEEQKARIEQSIRALEAGKGIPHESVMQEFRERLQS